MDSVNVSGVTTFMTNPLFRAVLTGLSGYFLYPQNDALVRIVRKHEWLRYVFLFLLIWQGYAGLHYTRTAIAVAIVYIIVTYIAPFLDQTTTTYA
jgi:hypothetical protein